MGKNDNSQKVTSSRKRERGKLLQVWKVTVTGKGSADEITQCWESSVGGVCHPG